MDIAEASALLATDGMLIKRPLMTAGKKLTLGFKEADFEKKLEIKLGVEDMTVYYSENGLWLEEVQEGIKVGISAKGQDDLGEVMFVDLTPETTQVEKDAALIGVEAAKAVTELTSPVKGQVVAWNLELSENPERLNSTKKEDNWIVILYQVDKELLSSLAISE